MQENVLTDSPLTATNHVQTWKTQIWVGEVNKTSDQNMENYRLNGKQTISANMQVRKGVVLHVEKHAQL